MIFMFSCAARIGMGPVYVIYGVGRFCMESDEWGTGRFSNFFSGKFGVSLISLKYANGLRNGANSDTHRCKQLTEHGEERCIKLREVAGFSAVRTIFQIVGPRKILHCLLGK